MLRMKILGPRCPNGKRVGAATLQGGIRQRNVSAVHQRTLSAELCWFTRW